MSNAEVSNKPKSAARNVLTYILKYGVPLLITVLLCVMLFRDVNFDEMMDIIAKQCDFTFIGIALGVAVFSHIFRAMRWQIQLRALGIDTPLFPLILSIFGTYAVNLVLPRLGEIWRTGYISKRQDAPFATVFGSMVADRLADTVTVLLLTVVTFLLASHQIGSYLSQNSGTLEWVFTVATSPWLWLGVAACVAVAWWFLKRPTENRLIGKLQHFVKGLWQGFAVVATMRGKGRWILLTLCIWGCYFFQLYIAFYAFGFTTDIIREYGILAVLVTFVLSSLAMGVPSNGGIGPWQWSVIVALGMYGLAQEPATAFANLVMGCQTLLLIALGLFTFVCIALTKNSTPKLRKG
ncbi:MAG: flippase-like domain-containing protein [Muribaculaceae bacterium]|nr:flippase-like domain-containing protein [Muribaculaceae bacterium]